MEVCGFRWCQLFLGAPLPTGNHGAETVYLLWVDQTDQWRLGIPQGRFSFLSMLGFQQVQLLAQLVHYLLMLTNNRLLFTNLEAQLCCLHLPGLKSLLLVFLFIV